MSCRIVVVLMTWSGLRASRSFSYICLLQVFLIGIFGTSVQLQTLRGPYVIAEFVHISV